MDPVTLAQAKKYTDTRKITRDMMAFPVIEGRPQINIFNKASVTKGYYVDRGSGNTIANTDYSHSDFIEVSGVTQYACNATASGEQLAFYDSNKVYISGLLNPEAFTTPVNAKYARIAVKLTSLDTFMLVKGNELPETYLPYINPLALNFDNSLLELEDAIYNSSFKDNLKKVTDGNLYNKNEVVNGWYVDRGDGGLKANASYTSSDYIPVLPGTTYTTNLTTSGEQLAFYDSSKNFVSGLLNPTVFTAPSTAKFVRLGVHVSNLSKVMLVVGSSLPSQYVPYYSLELKNVIVTSPISISNTNIIRVAKSGGDYTTVQGAVNGANDSASNPVTILIYPGIYEEKVYIGPTRYISLVGFNKLTTIIQDHDGIHGNDPLRFEGTGYCKGIQVISTGLNVTDLTTSFAYALHIDNGDGLGGDQYYEDCIFRSHTSAAVGIGVQQDQEVRFKNCEMYSTAIDAAGASRYGGFFAHSSNRRPNVTGQSVVLEGCFIHSLYNHAIAIEDMGSGSQQMSVTFINNTLYCDETMDDPILRSPITSGNFSGVINLSPLSHGNNISALNA